jgi:carbamate kinase
VVVVIALGGNALLRRGEPVSTKVQRKNMKRAGIAIAEVAREHKIVVTHGNGPQVGLLAMQEAAYGEFFQNPLDVLGAETEGMIGFLIEQELNNQLLDRKVATILTRVEIDPDDPAWRNPTKPIGPLFSKEEAVRLAAERDWVMAPDGPDGEKLRRVVPSPLPKRILSMDAIQLLMESSTIVICGGGGGIPVIWNEKKNGWRGVEAVIDKDMTAALLATQLGADALIMLTDVSAVELGWGTPEAHPLERATVEELRETDFQAGSMGPKVSAAVSFVEATGGFAGIGALQDAARIVRHEAGTIITAG